MTDSTEYGTTGASNNRWDDFPPYLPPLPREQLLLRKNQFGRVWSFLNANASTEDEEKGVVNTPPAIMVISGPRGVGKSTLALRVAYEAEKEHIFKNILWFNKRRFLELFHGSQPLGAPPSYTAEETTRMAEATRNFWENPNNEDLLEQLHRFGMQFGGESEAEPPPVAFVRQYLRTIHPYLILIDDIDEDFADKTPLICQELAWVRAPNKVILTSRTPLPFKGVEPKPLSLGLLDTNQINALVDCECSSDKLPSQYVFGGNQEKTQKWIRNNVGGFDLSPPKLYQAECDYLT